MPRFPSSLWLLLLLPVVLVPGCRSPQPRAQLGKIYNRAAQYHGPERNPVVVIPGILGSRLENAHSGDVVWGAFDLGAANLKTAQGLRALALPMRTGTPLHELEDPVVATRALDRVTLRVFGLPLEMKAYAQILKVLGAGGYRDRDVAGSMASTVDFGEAHFTCFQFAYDWRRDLPENARRLEAFLREKEAEVAAVYRERFGITEPRIQFDLVGHSMGGLLTRYYLRYGAGEPEGPPTWAGARRVDQAILIAPPNAGSSKGFTELLQGLDVRPIVYGPPAVIGTFPSVYQLMPRDRHHIVKLGAGESLYDVALWDRNEWGLLNPEQDPVLERLLPGVRTAARRRAIARDHVQKCLTRAAAVQRALDRPASPPPGTRIHLVAGDATPTPSEITPGKRGAFDVTDFAPGDEDVTRASALLDERQDGTWSPTLRSPVDFASVRFHFREHLALTQDPEFHDNLLYLLLEAPD